MKRQIVVGLPSYNEADTIGKVTKDIDNALQTSNFDFEAVLINADNNSLDGTQQAFLGVETVFHKKGISTSTIGKGANLISIMQYVVDSGSAGVIFLDTDLETVPASWVHSFLAQLFNDYDAVFSRRAPRWNRGDLTYHLTFPSIGRFWNANIHEPISGDFAFSNRFCRQALQARWSSPLLGFGIDFYLASVATQFRWCEVILEGRKVHPARSFVPKQKGIITMRPKFEEVLLSIKYCLNQEDIAANRYFDEPIIDNVIGKPDWEYAIVPDFDQDVYDLADTLRQKNLSAMHFEKIHSGLVCLSESDIATGISFRVWWECVENFVFDRIEENEKTDVIDVMETLFFLRLIYYHNENKGKNDWYDKIEKNAQDRISS